MGEPRVFPCGCVLCVCPDEWERCGGCGAESCGQPGTVNEHVPGGKPRSMKELLDRESALESVVRAADRLVDSARRASDDMCCDCEVVDDQDYTCSACEIDDSIGLYDTQRAAVGEIGEE